jgi:hypothetical protein
MSDEPEIGIVTLTTSEQVLYYWLYLQLCRMFYHPHKALAQTGCASLQL